MYNLTHSKKLVIAAVTTMAMLIPESAYSLGVGDIKLHSGFNQNLNAEIELITSANEEVSNLYIGLASPEKFDEAGIPWSYFLKKIKFKPVKKSNGELVIELSSKEALKELFLSFVLEVSWNKSNHLDREFTVLVDPSPSYHLAAASLKYKRKPIAENQSAITNSLNREQTKGKNTPQYGPIKRSDFIWKIAKKTRYPDVSIEQMIIALFKINPDAFYADNINALTTKEMLDIPEKAVALEMSRKEALAAVNQQNEEWKHRNAKTSVATTDSGTMTDIARVSSQIASEPFDLRLTSKATSFSDKGASFSRAEQPKEKTASVISSAEGLALLARLDKLEQKLDKLLSEKQSTTPTLSNAASVENATETPSKPLVASSEGLALLTRQDELEKKLEMMQKLQPLNNAPAATPQDIKQPTAALQTDNTPHVVEPIKQTANNSLSPVAEQPETNALQLALYGMGGGILLSGLGAFWWINRKKQQQAEMQRSSKYSSSALSTPPIDVLITKDKGFLSDHVDAFDSEHIEPMTEIDMYLTHGLYDNAERLMRETIKYHPEKNEYHLKLLEIFLASKNKAAFYEHVKKLTEMGKNDDLVFLEAIAKMETALHSETVFDLSKLDAKPNVKADNPQQPVVKETVPEGTFDLSEFEIESAANQSLEASSAETPFDAELDSSAETAVDILQNNAVSDSEPLQNETADSNEIEFNSTEFEAESIVITDVEMPDNDQLEKDWFDDQSDQTNEIAFDLSDFETEPVTENEIDFFDDPQADSHQVAFDVFDFDSESDASTAVAVVENVETDPQQAQVLLEDDAEIVAGNSMEFDLSDFDIEPVKKTIEEK